jgi:hypothetical protein
VVVADVFLSYKRDERDVVERLATALRGLGLKVWFDASLSAGDSFSTEIHREVSSARAVVVCWSPGAAESRWVRAEAQAGFDNGNLISILVAGPDRFKPPVPFNSVHMEDMRAWRARPSARDPAWVSVLRALGRILHRSDITEWCALSSQPSVEEVKAWLIAHGAKSPLVIEAEGLLREIEAIERERVMQEAAARERAARLRAEQEAAEAAARAEQERATVEAQTRAAELEERRRAELEADSVAYARLLWPIDLLHGVPAALLVWALIMHLFRFGPSWLRGWVETGLVWAATFEGEGEGRVASSEALFLMALTVLPIFVILHGAGGSMIGFSSKRWSPQRIF